MASLRTLRRLEDPRTRWGDDEEAVALRLRPLRGERLWVRPRTADRFALHDTFRGRYHLPPAELTSTRIRRIWDLGSNIGSTVAHLAVLFPDAHITGVEMDGENAELCRRNVARWGGRCEILHAAVWSAPGEVSYRRDVADELSFRVGPLEQQGGETLTVPTVSLAELAERMGDRGEVDFVKMDIEGAEAQVLREGVGWAEHVRAIKVEVHPPYDVAACVRDLQELGFATRLDDRHWAAVVGLRA
jgi:FkbM family methyltransferase